jgi:hypothetical protein
VSGGWCRRAERKTWLSQFRVHSKTMFRGCTKSDSKQMLLPMTKIDVEVELENERTVKVLIPVPNGITVIAE